MLKGLTLVAALATVSVLSFANPADAAQGKANGLRTAQTSEGVEVSDQRRYRRYYRNRYYGPRAYYRPAPYYGYSGYGYPYGYRQAPGVYFGAPGVGFSLGF